MSRLKPIRRQRRTGSPFGSRPAVRSVFIRPSCAARVVVGAVRRKAPVAGAEAACWAWIQATKAASLDDLPGVEHVAVPEPAELGAADVEAADLGGST